MARVDGLNITSFSVTDSAGTARDVVGIRSFDPGKNTNLLDVTTIDEVFMNRVVGLQDQELRIHADVDNTANTGTVAVFLLNDANVRTVKIQLDTGLFYNGKFLIESIEVSRPEDADLTLDVVMKCAEDTTATYTTS